MAKTLLVDKHINHGNYNYALNNGGYDILFLPEAEGVLTVGHMIFSYLPWGDSVNDELTYALVIGNGHKITISGNYNQNTSIFGADNEANHTVTNEFNDSISRIDDYDDRYLYPSPNEIYIHDLQYNISAISYNSNKSFGALLFEGANGELVLTAQAGAEKSEYYYTADNTNNTYKTDDNIAIFAAAYTIYNNYLNNWNHAPAYRIEMADGNETAEDVYNRRGSASDRLFHNFPQITLTEIAVFKAAGTITVSSDFAGKYNAQASVLHIGHMNPTTYKTVTLYSEDAEGKIDTIKNGDKAKTFVDLLPNPGEMSSGNNSTSAVVDADTLILDSNFRADFKSSQNAAAFTAAKNGYDDDPNNDGQFVASFKRYDITTGIVTTDGNNKLATLAVTTPATVTPTGLTILSFTSNTAKDNTIETSGIKAKTLRTADNTIWAGSITANSDNVAIYANSDYLYRAVGTIEDGYFYNQIKYPKDQVLYTQHYSYAVTPDGGTAVLTNNHINTYGIKSDTTVYIDKMGSISRDDATVGIDNIATQTARISVTANNNTFHAKAVASPEALLNGGKATTAVSATIDDTSVNTAAIQGKAVTINSIETGVNFTAMANNNTFTAEAEGKEFSIRDIYESTSVSARVTAAITANALSAETLIINSISGNVTFSAEAKNNAVSTTASGYVKNNTGQSVFFDFSITANALSANNITLGDVDSGVNFSATATGNTGNYYFTAGSSWGNDTTVTVNGIYAKQKLQLAYFNGNIAASGQMVDGNNPILPECDVYGINAGTLTTTSALAGKITVTSNNDWLSPSFYGINVGSMTVNGLTYTDINGVNSIDYYSAGISVFGTYKGAGYAGTISNITAAGIGAVKFVGENSYTINRTTYYDAFDITGNISVYGNAITSAEALNIRVSGKVESKNTIFGRQGVAISGRGEYTDDKVEIAASALVLGDIDLGAGVANAITISSQATIEGTILAPYGSVNITFNLEGTANDRSTVQINGSANPDDKTLKDSETITINLNYAENGSYKLIHYGFNQANGLALVNYWNERQIAFRYQGTTVQVNLAIDPQNQNRAISNTIAVAEGINVRARFENNSFFIDVIDGNPSASAVAADTKLDANDPDVFTAIANAAKDSVTISWQPLDASEYNLDQIALYEIEYIIYDENDQPIGYSANSTVSVRVNGSANSYTINGVRAGQTLKYRVRFLGDASANKVSAWSELNECHVDPAVVVTPNPYTDNALVNFQASTNIVSVNPIAGTKGVTGAIAELHWDKIEAANPIRNYEIEYIMVSDLFTREDISTAGFNDINEFIIDYFNDNANADIVYRKLVTGTEATLSNLQNQSYVYWRIRAIDSTVANDQAADPAGRSDWVVGETFRVWIEDDLTAPSWSNTTFQSIGFVFPAAEVTAPAAGVPAKCYSSTIAWTKAADSESGIRTYRIKYSTDGGKTFTDYTDAAGNIVEVDAERLEHHTCAQWTNGNLAVDGKYFIEVKDADGTTYTIGNDSANGDVILKNVDGVLTLFWSSKIEFAARYDNDGNKITQDPADNEVVIYQMIGDTPTEIARIKGYDQAVNGYDYTVFDYSITLDTTPLNDNDGDRNLVNQQYVYQIIAEDYFGNTSVMTQTVNADNTAPVFHDVTIDIDYGFSAAVNPADLTEKTHLTGTVSWSIAKDSESGVRSYTVTFASVDGLHTVTRTFSAVELQNYFDENTQKFTLDLETDLGQQLTKPAYTCTIVAKDYFGNTSIQLVENITADTSAPVFTDVTSAVLGSYIPQLPAADDFTSDTQYTTVIGWNAAQDEEGGSGIRAYVIEVKEQGSNQWVRYDVVAADDIQNCAVAYYENANLDTTKEYVVCEYNAETKTYTELDCRVDAKIVNGKKVLSWYAIGQQFDGRQLTIRVRNSDDTYTNIATISGNAGQAVSGSYSYTNFECCYNGGALLSGERYTFRIQAVDYFDNYSAPITGDTVNGNIIADYGNPVFGNNASKCELVYFKNEFNEVTAFAPTITWKPASDYAGDSGVRYYAVYIRGKNSNAWGQATLFDHVEGQESYTLDLTDTQYALGEYEYKIVATDYFGKTAETTGTFGSDDFAAPDGAFRSFSNKIYTVYSDVIEIEEIPIYNDKHTAITGYESKEIVVGKKLESLSIVLSWTDNFSDPSGIIYKVTIYDDKNDPSTYKEFWTTSKTITFDNTTPGCPVGIFSNMNNINWYVEAFDNSANHNGSEFKGANQSFEFINSTGGNITTTYYGKGTVLDEEGNEVTADIIYPVTIDRITAPTDISITSDEMVDSDSDGVLDRRTDNVAISWTDGYSTLGSYKYTITLYDSTGRQVIYQRDTLDLTPDNYSKTDLDSIVSVQNGVLSIDNLKTFFNIGTLEDGKYKLDITAHDASGNSATSQQLELNIDTTRPDAVVVTEQSAVSNNFNGIKYSDLILKWQEPADASGIDYYEVWYKKTSESNWTQVETTETTFTLSDVRETNHDYEFRVVAIDKAGNRGFEWDEGDSVVIEPNFDKLGDFVSIDREYTPEISFDHQGRFAVADTVGKGDIADTFQFTTGNNSCTLDLTVAYLNNIVGTVKNIRMEIYKVNAQGNIVCTNAYQANANGKLFSDLLLDANTTYIVKFYNTNYTHSISDYNFIFEKHELPCGNADDTLALAQQQTPLTVGERSVISDWVGFGDLTDGKILDLQESGKYVFKLDGVATSTQLIIYEIGANNQLIAVASIAASQYNFNGAQTRELLLDKNKTYFITVTSTNRSVQGTDYTVEIERTVAYNVDSNEHADGINDARSSASPLLTTNINGVNNGWVGFGDAYDYWKLDVDDTNGGVYNFTLSHTKGVDEGVQLYIYQKVGTNYRVVRSVYLAKTSESVSTGNIYLAGDATTPYYVGINAPGAANAQNSFYTLDVNGYNIDALKIGDQTDNLRNNNTPVITLNHGTAVYNDWVGAGDASDFRRLDVDDVNGGVYNFTLSHDKSEEAVRINIIQYNRTVNGVDYYTTLRSFVLNKNVAEITTGSIYLAGDADKPYYIEIASLNPTAGLNSNYELTVNGYNITDAMIAKDTIAPLSQGQTITDRWVGVGDTYDYFQLTNLNTAGNYTLTLNNTNGREIALAIGYFNTNGTFVTLMSGFGTVNSDKLVFSNNITQAHLDTAARYSGIGYEGLYVKVYANGYNTNSNYDITLENNESIAGFDTTDNTIAQAIQTGAQMGLETIQDWVGLGDNIDVRKLNVTSDGLYNIDLTGIENTTRLNVYKVTNVVNNYGQTNYYTQLVKSITVNATQGEGHIANMYLDGDSDPLSLIGDYFVEITGISAAAGLNTGYSLSLSAVSMTQLPENYLNNNRHNDYVFNNEVLPEANIALNRFYVAPDANGAYNFTVDASAVATNGYVNFAVYEMLSNGGLRLIKSVSVRGGTTANTGELILNNTATTLSTGIYKVELKAANNAAVGNCSVSISGYDFTNYLAGAELDNDLVISTANTSGKNWVGMGDAQDGYLFPVVDQNGVYTINLDGINGNSIRIAIVDVATNRVLNYFTPAYNATSATFSYDFKAGINYMIRVESTDNGYSRFSEYELSLESRVNDVNRVDNALVTAENKVAIDALDHLSTTNSIDGWVGTGDLRDYIKLDVATTGSYNVDLSNYSNNATVMLYEITGTNATNGAPYSRLLKSASALTTADKVELSDLLLDATKEYYLVVQGYATNGTMDTEYTVSLEQNQIFNVDSDSKNNVQIINYSNKVSNWIGFADASDHFSFIALAGATNITLAYNGNECGNITMSIIKIDASGRESYVKTLTLTKNTANMMLSTGDLCLEAGMIYRIDLSTPQASTGVNAGYQMTLNGWEFVNYATANDNIANNANVLAIGNTVSSAVWQSGDNTDYYRVNITEEQAGSYSIALNGITASAIRVSIGTVDANGNFRVLQSASGAYNATVAYLSRNLTAGEYVIKIESVGSNTASKYDLTMIHNDSRVGFNTDDNTWQQLSANVDATLYKAEGATQATISDWVGFGDTADTFKVATDENGQLIFSGNNASSRAAITNNEIYLTLVDAKGVGIGLVFDRNNGTYTTNTVLMADSEYYLTVTSRTPSTTNTDYQIAINKKN